MNKFSVNFADKCRQTLIDTLVFNLLLVVTLVATMTTALATPAAALGQTTTAELANAKNMSTLSLQAPKQTIFQGQASQWLLITP